MTVDQWFVLGLIAALYGSGLLHGASLMTWSHRKR